MADLLGTAARSVSAWERGAAEPTHALVTGLQRLCADLPPELMARLSMSIGRTELPRALSRGPALRLQALSGPAIAKRPSIVEWIGKDLAPIACGALQDMLSDTALQRAIRRREIAGIVSTTRSVLRTSEAEHIGTYRTTISYFFHDGTLYSDAVAVPSMAGERIGWTPLLADELGTDLFGDAQAIDAGLVAPTASKQRQPLASG